MDGGLKGSGKGMLRRAVAAGIGCSIGNGQGFEVSDRSRVRVR